MLHTLLLAVSILLLHTTIYAQTPDTSVIINGAVEHPQTIGLSDLMRLPSHSAEVEDHGGATLHYEGALLSDVLKLAGAPEGEKLRGRYLARFYLLVTGADGPGAIFALPEVDPTFSDRKVILAYRVNGKPLSPRDGPLQIVVPSDKRHGRWVRRVVSISIVEREGSGG